MACCRNPEPRVLESSGRMFCNNCQRYLDKKATPVVEVRTIRLVDEDDPPEPPSLPERKDQ